MQSYTPCEDTIHAFKFTMLNHWHTGDRYDELWYFNTLDIEWHKPELEGPSPPPRYAHSAVAFRGLLYIFGGYGGDDSWLGDCKYMPHHASCLLFCLAEMLLSFAANRAYTRPYATLP